MHDTEPPGITGVIFAFLFMGAVLGFFLGVVIDRSYMTRIQWDELVKRGYAEEIETSLGKGYRWKDESRNEPKNTNDR